MTRTACVQPITFLEVDGYYIYVENSEDNDVGESARLNSPSVSFSANQPKCLSFWYNMYGAHIGSSNVYLKSNTLGSTVWSRKTTYEDKLMQAKVNLLVPSDESRTIVLEAVQGYNILGGIAIDDITFQNGYCSPGIMSCDFENGLCAGTHDISGDFNWAAIRGDANVGPALDHTYEAINAECNFEDGRCSWTNSLQLVDEDIYWIMNMGSKGTDDTGPSVDHKTGLDTGTYLLMDASGSSTDVKAKLYSEVLSAEQGYRCLEFWYYMYGSDMGTLTVDVTHADNPESPDTIWTLSGDQNDKWNYGKVPFKTVKESQQQLVLHFHLKDEQEFVTSTTCNIESNECGWYEGTPNDKFNWHRASGYDTKVKPVIAPRYDHTSKSLYKSSEENAPRLLIWHKHSSQGDRWNYANVVIGNTHSFKVVFEVFMGNANASDIAIDDVTFTESCLHPDNATLVGFCPRNHLYCPGDQFYSSSGKTYVPMYGGMDNGGMSPSKHNALEADTQFQHLCQLCKRENMVLALYMTIKFRVCIRQEALYNLQ
ncbi:MAM and LDL-receptor class A domain-containing protein 1-like [Glandiceps talaboti]